MKTDIITTHARSAFRFLPIFAAALAAAPWDLVEEEQALAKEALALVRAKLKAEKEKELDDDDSSHSPVGVSSEGSSD